MTPSINDLFTKVALATKTELGSPGHTSGGVSIICADLSSWAAAAAENAVYFGMDRVQTVTVSGQTQLRRINGTYTEWKGIVSGNTIGSMVLKAGDDQDYPAGSETRVYMLVTASWANSMVQGLLVSHNKDGSVKDGVIGEDQLSTAAVTTAKMDSSSVTKAKIDFSSGIWGEEIGRTTLASAGDLMTVSSLPARKYLKIIVSAILTGSTSVEMRFNNDSGTSYARRFSANGGTDTAEASQTAMVLTTTEGGANVFAEVEVINIATKEKTAIGHAVSGSSGAGSNPTRWDSANKWANTADLINRIDIINPGTGDFAIGSEVIILGHD
ncbi:MAG TPA: hypothetical protein VLH38_03290 [Patescibacteria group bacterium]|nr:hypothetical protein [Patescibacteria group bacterium]